MLGYVTERKAVIHGATHHGSYYGIPLWMGDVDSQAPLVFTKWAPLELLMDVFHFVEAIIFPMIYGEDEEPSFMFKIVRAIDTEQYGGI